MKLDDSYLETLLTRLNQAAEPKLRAMDPKSRAGEPRRSAPGDEEPAPLPASVDVCDAPPAMNMGRRCVRKSWNGDSPTTGAQVAECQDITERARRASSGHWRQPTGPK